MTPIFSWENQPYTSAFLSGANLHRAAESGGPLLHSGEAKAMLANDSSGKTYSVVFDLNRDLAGA